MARGIPARTMPDAAHLSGRVAVALMSEEALAPLVKLPAIARIDVLGAKLRETGS
jgi:hypothetical protein